VDIQMKLIIKDSMQKGKTLAGLKLVGMFIQSNKELYLGSNNVDALADRIKEMYPDAKLSKHNGYVLVEKRE